MQPQCWAKQRGTFTWVQWRLWKVSSRKRPHPTRRRSEGFLTELGSFRSVLSVGTEGGAVRRQPAIGMFPQGTVRLDMSRILPEEYLPHSKPGQSSCALPPHQEGAGASNVSSGGMGEPSGKLVRKLTFLPNTPSALALASDSFSGPN